jgi:hypothetical protein
MDTRLAAVQHETLDNDGMTELCTAAYKGDVEELRRLLTYVDHKSPSLFGDRLRAPEYAALGYLDNLSEGCVPSELRRYRGVFRLLSETGKIELPAWLFVSHKIELDFLLHI